MGRLTEDELLAAVQALCAGFGLYCYHVPDSRRASAPGWPDLVIIGQGVLWRELKGPHGTLTPEQTQLGYRLRAIGQDWQAWYPRHWTAGIIRQQLTQIA